MERHEMHPLKRAIVGNPQPAPTQFAKGSNPHGIPIKNGFTEQAKPKVCLWWSINRTTLRATATFQFYSDILLFAYIFVQLGNSGAVCESSSLGELIVNPI